MARDYWAAFGGGSLGAKSGLAPTFITFINGGGSNIAAPSVTEPGSKGLYKFSYDATQTIAFVLDGATTGLVSSDRFVSGVIEAQDNFGITLTAIGTTTAGMGVSLTALGVTFGGFGTSLVAMGDTLAGMGVTFSGFGVSLLNLGSLIGTTASSFGSTSVEPGDLFGFLRRAQEFQEGNQTYIKATGILDFYSRGSSTLLREAKSE